MNDMDRMIEATGVTLPLAARMVALVLDSGASQVEVLTALAVVRTVTDLLPIPLLSEGVGAPELLPRAS